MIERTARSRWIGAGGLSVLAFVLCAGSGCMVEKNRAALVPHMVPSPRSGQPIHGGRGSLYLHHSAVTHMRNPHEARDSNSGVYIPRYQIGGGGRIRFGQNWDLGFIFEHGLRSGSIAVAPDVPPRPNQDVFGLGMSVGYSIPATPRFRVGLVLDTLLYAVPKVEYYASECNKDTNWENCTPVNRETNVVPVFSLSVIPSVLVSRFLVLFGGITVRNHPTIEKEGWALDGTDKDVEMGPPNVTLGVGAEFRLHRRLFFMLQMYYPVTRNPVVYYPVVGAGFSVSLGQEYEAVVPHGPPAGYPQPPVGPTQGPGSPTPYPVTPTPVPQPVPDQPAPVAPPPPPPPPPAPPVPEEESPDQGD